MKHSFPVPKDSKAMLGVVSRTMSIKTTQDVSPVNKVTQEIRYQKPDR